MKKVQPKFLDEGQKIDLLRKFDNSGMNVEYICKEYDISRSYLYKIKREYWPHYQSAKVALPATQRAAVVSATKVDSRRRIAMIENQASNVIGRVLGLIDHKISLEEMRLRGEQRIGDDGEPIKWHDKDIVTVQDLTKFFQVAAPYFLKVVEDAPVKAGTIAKKHSYLTQIFNQQINNIQNANNKDTDTGVTAE